MSSVMWTPAGPVSLGREEVIVPPEYLKMIAVLADTSSEMKLGLHCSKCKQDLRGSNGLGDNRWTMECGCRTFVGRNPIPQRNRN